MAVLKDLKPTGHAGVFYKDHDTRKNGVKYDRQWFIRQTFDGKTRLSALPWTSEGFLLGDALNKAAEYKAHHKWNQEHPGEPAKPICRADELALIEAERERIEQEDENNPLFSALCERYLAEYAEPKLKPKTLAEYQRQINKHLLPALGKLKLSKVSFRHIDRLITGLAKDKPILANRVLALLKGIFTFAVKKRLISASPAALYEPPAKERPKDRYLSMDEIKALWLFMSEGADRDCSDAVKLILLTGCRPGEIINLTMKEIDKRADGKWIALSADRTKNKQPHQAYLSPLAAEIIQKRIDGGLVRDSLLFPAETTSRRTGKARIVSMRGDVLTHKVTRLCRDLTAADIPVEKFAAHDLRRSCATHVARIGYAGTVAEILNHKQRNVTRVVYDQYDRLPEIKRALEAWSLTIERELRGGADNVVLMAAGAPEAG